MADVVNMMMFVQHGSKFPSKLKIKGTVSSTTLIGYLKYAARGDSRDNLQDQPLEFVDGYLGYTSRDNSRSDNKEIKTFTNDGWITEGEQKTFRETVAKYFCKDGDLAWIPVTSFKDYLTAEQYGLMKEEDYAAIFSKTMPKFFNRVGLDPKNMIWWFDYHSNKNHPHTHMVFLEKEKTRTKGTFKPDDIKYFKGLIINEANKRLQLINGIKTDKSLFVEKDILKKEVKELALGKIKEKQYSPLNDQIERLFRKIDRDKVTGRLQYNSTMMMPYRMEVDLIVDAILNHEDVFKKYHEFEIKLDKYDESAERVMNQKYQSFKNIEIKKLKVQIANSVLQMKKENDYLKYKGDESANLSHRFNQNESDDESVNLSHQSNQNESGDDRKFHYSKVAISENKFNAVYQTEKTTRKHYARNSIVSSLNHIAQAQSKTKYMEKKEGTDAYYDEKGVNHDF